LDPLDIPLKSCKCLQSELKALTSIQFLSWIKDAGQMLQAGCRLHAVTLWLVLDETV
jgi:hypothetical protein